MKGLAAPLKVFDGSAREGAKGFPANVNVAAALSLAGIGPDRTRLQIWADPGVTRNTHTITVDADAMRFTADDRECAVRQSAHRQERGALDHRRLARAGVGAENRQLDPAGMTKDASMKAIRDR